MDFKPTETQVMFGDMVTALLDAEYSFERRHKQLAERQSHDPEIWTKLAELGVLGAEIDPAFGGSGVTFEDLAAAFGPIGRALLVEPVLATVILGAGIISSLGSDAQKSALLPDVAAGTVKVALAHAERQARDVVGWVTSSAKRIQQGWRLAGGKAVVLGGDLASHFIVSARTSGEGADPEGISLFIVPKDTSGMKVRAYTLYDGSGAADLILEDAAVPADAMLGTEGGALPALELAYDRARAALCAEAVGAMEGLRDLTLDYMKTRVQFGQPIGKFQALQHRIVDAHVELELARSMALLAINAISETDPGRRRRCIAAAKAKVGRAARTLGQSSVQIHGGIALTDEYAAGHYFKRLTMIERLFGDIASSTRRFASLAA